MAYAFFPSTPQLTLAGDGLDPGDLAADNAELGGVGGALGGLEDTQADELVAELGLELDQLLGGAFHASSEVFTGHHPS